MIKVDCLKFLWRILCGLICINRISAKCTQQNEEIIHKCVLPLKQYAENLGQNSKAGQDSSMPSGVGSLLPVFQDGDVFENLCDVVARFEYCIRFAKTFCPNHVVVRLMTVSYGYLCNEGKIDFLANAHCLTKLDKIPEIKQCHEVTLKSIVSVNQDSTVDVDQKMGQTCRWLNYFSDCIRSRIMSDCGSKAWSIIFRVLRDTATTLMPNCIFSSYDLSPSSSKRGHLQQSRIMVNDRQSSSYVSGNGTIQGIVKHDINFPGNRDRMPALEAKRNARFNSINGRNSCCDHLVVPNILLALYMIVFYFKAT